MVRDSRGVAFSRAKRRQRLAVTTGVEYMERHGTLMSALLWDVAQVGSEPLRVAGLPCHRIRYEDLVERPSEVMRELVAFAGGDENAAERFVGAAFRAGDQHVLSGNPARMQSGSIVLKADEEWVTGLGRRQRIVATAATAPLLARYGYLGRRRVRRRDDHGDRPERGRFVDGQRQEHHGENVLDDEDANGDAPGQ
jgi:hypothetical protein